MTLAQNDPVERRRALISGRQSRLPRALIAYVCDGSLPETVQDHAGRRETDGRLPAIVATIKGADPDITLQAICNRMETMRERTTAQKVSRGFHLEVEDIKADRKMLVLAGDREVPTSDGLRAMPLTAALDQLRNR